MEFEPGGAQVENQQPAMTGEINVTPTPDGGRILEAELILPRPLDELFSFFSDASNLERITPSMLHFHILTPQPIVMAEGVLIDYKLRIHGIPVKWRTRISAWEPNHRFVDEQIRGPYRRWIHEHTFDAVEGGTRCRDRVAYRAPGGALVSRWLVDRDVRAIFAYRHQRLIALLSG